MPQIEYQTRGIKIWVWLGVAILVFAVVLPVIGIGYVVEEANRQLQCEGRSPKDPGCAPSFVWNAINATKGALSEEINEAFPSTSTAPKTPGLGEEGSACGGPMRLPCKPGLTCESSPDEELGVCVQAAPASEPYRVRSENEACGSEPGPCGVNLVCKMSPGMLSGVCIKEEAASPKILSLKLDGMQLSQGTYLAEPGTEVTVTVKASNAQSVSLYLRFDVGRSEPVGLVEQKDGSFKGGTFVGTFKVPAGLLADLEIIVRDADGLESGLAVDVSATK